VFAGNRNPAYWTLEQILPKSPRFPHAPPLFPHVLPGIAPTLICDADVRRRTKGESQMNRKPLTLTTLTIFTSACTTIEHTNEILPMVSDLQTIVQASQAYLPTGMFAPNEFPTTISDAQLMAAWIYLYNQVKTIIFWDGSTWSGKQLALFLLENDVPINWSVSEICQYSSTVRPVCESADCARREEVDYPIYLDSTLKEAKLRRSLASWRTRPTTTLSHSEKHAIPFSKNTGLSRSVQPSRANPGDRYSKGMNTSLIASSSGFPENFSSPLTKSLDIQK
jgi:hypothetical protein